MENAQQPVRNKNGKTQKLPKSRISFWVTPIVFLIFFIGLFTLFAIPMGLSNMLSTVMNTAFALLTDTCLYIMAIAVIMGAVSALLTEFGVVAMLNHLLSPLMKPIYGLPGAAALGKACLGKVRPVVPGGKALRKIAVFASTSRNINFTA